MIKGKSLKNRIKDIVLPSVVFGSLSGIFTATAVILFRFFASKTVDFTREAYDIMGKKPIFIPVAFAVMLLVAYIFKVVLTKYPHVKGGGIPTSIAWLRGLENARWITSTVYVFALSLLSFLAGVPLGTEGPSVQMGTSIGKGVVSIFARKHRAYSRYSMTGGACAGFASATGAPMSGMMFAIEEAHQRLSPMIITVSVISVFFASVTTSLLAPLFNLSTSLFAFGSGVKKLALQDMWIPLALGILLGLFAVLFLNLYKLINRFVNGAFKNAPFYVRILSVLALTLVFGLISFDFISTGHELTAELIKQSKPILFLLAVLAIRSALTLFANSNGITGGMFLPLISLGAVLSAVFASVCIKYFGLSQDYYTVTIALGISACIAGMMKMPLTAVFFGVEALSCGENIIPVMLGAAAAYFITEIFNVKSINETVMENRLHSEQSQERVTIDTCVTVAENSFAVGKQVRDVFWPNNLIVLGVRKCESDPDIADAFGENSMLPGDVLHVRCQTSDPERTMTELYSIVGTQQ